MTDLVTPPEDPQLQLAWARQALRDFPPQSCALGAKAIRAWVREILKAHSPPGPGGRRKRRRAQRLENKPEAE
jgi:hypothetical protein